MASRDRGGGEWRFRPRAFLALAFGGAIVVAALAGRGFAPQTEPVSPEAIRIDVRAPAHPFPHFWEQVMGSGRASLSLRESYRRDLRTVKAATALEYVRFHAIFQDENGIYDEDMQGRPVYNFTYVDQIYDGLLEAGVRPFVELSFMPKKLAASQAPHPFWYLPLPSPPKDYGKWGDLIHEFAAHLVARYGLDEVAQWYFEVWNEPNLDFWSGEPKEEAYDRLYETTSRALKGVSPRLRVGGPATAQAAWVDRFIRFCVDRNVPIDFVSTHVYANDRSEDVFGTSDKIDRSDMVARAVRKVHDQVKRSARPNLPIHWTEYNASYMNELEVTDSPFMGPWLANNIRQCDGLTDTMAYWTFSDVFEEQGVAKTPFYGGFGLIAVGGIPKASFNAFQLLNQLGTERIPSDSPSVIATRRPDGGLVLALWNYAPPGEQGGSRDLRVQFTGVSGNRRMLIHRLDANHGSALTAWRAMGSPSFPTREQQRDLRRSAQMAAPEQRMFDAGKESGTTVTVPPHGLVLIELLSR